MPIGINQTKSTLTMGNFRIPAFAFFLPTVLIEAATPTNTSSFPSQGTPCPTPTTFANVVLPPPPKLVGKSYSPSNEVALGNAIFPTIITNNVGIPQASVFSYCLDECIEYQLSTGKPCLSVFINQGLPSCLTPPCPDVPNATPNWYCAAYNKSLTQADYVARNEPGSFQFGVGINRVCGGNFRAY